MNEEIQMALDEAREKMDKAISRLEGELSKIRAGKAHPSAAVLAASALLALL